MVTCWESGLVVPRRESALEAELVPIRVVDDEWIRAAARVYAANALNEGRGCVAIQTALIAARAAVTLCSSFARMADHAPFS